MPLDADLIVYHARIYTVDDAFSVAEAMAVRDGRILEWGTDAAILSGYQARRRLDTGGACVYPGFVDAHSHFLSYGLSLRTVALSGAASWEEVLSRVCRFADTVPHGWITGRGWDQHAWQDPAFPDQAELSRLFPDRPVFLTRVDGHAAIANEAALAMAGIRPDTRVPGGEIGVRTGRLTGLLLDNALDLVTGIIPPPTEKTKERGLLEAQEHCFAVGLTTVSECGLGRADIALEDRLQREGRLLMRLYVMASDDPVLYAHYLATGPYHTDRMDVGGFKLFSDGALGSRGAALLAPYADRPGWTGLMLKPRAYFQQTAERLLDSGFQMCTHAIGDAAARMVLDVYGSVLKGKNSRRWRIEHAQVLAPEDIGRFGRYGVVPSVQPTHATSDMPWAEARLGPDRLRGAYAFRRLLAQNGWLPLGTDFPVEGIRPMDTFCAAVTRCNAKGLPPGGFLPEEVLSPRDALRGMTIWAAMAGFQERDRGSLEPGKWADFVILDRDILEVSPRLAREARVTATYLGGEPVYGDPA